MQLIDTVRRRLFLLAAAGLAPLIALGILATVWSTRALRADVIRGDGLAARTLAARLDTYTKRYVILLQGLAQGMHLDVAPTPDQLTALLADQRNEFSELTHLELCDLAGHLVASGEPADLSPPCDRAIHFAGPDAPAYYSDTILTPELHPQITLAVPRVERGRVTGILRADVDLVAMWQIVDGFSVGTSGRARLTDAHGRVIAHGDPELRYEVFRDQNDGSAGLVQRILAATPGTPVAGEYQDGVGRDVLGVGARVPHLGWAAVVEVPAADAFRAVRALWIALAVAAAVFVILGVSIALLIARSLTAPIDSLRARARAIGGGDLSQAPLPPGTVETRELARGMNEMVVKLAELQEHIRRAERLDLLARTASSLVHDLEQPIRAMHLAVEPALDQPDNVELRAWAREMLEESSTQVKGLFDDVRRVVRNELLVLKPCDVDLVDLGDRVIKVLRQQVNPEVQFVLDAPAPVRLLVDPRHLRRAIHNLTKNALEAQKEKGPGTVRLHIERTEDGGARIEVSDEGAGIAPGRIDGLFGALQSTKRTGMGIGLASVKLVVERHGGQVSVASTVGVGTRFTIVLPPTSQGSLLAAGASQAGVTA